METEREGGKKQKEMRDRKWERKSEEKRYEVRVGEGSEVIENNVRYSRNKCEQWGERESKDRGRERKRWRVKYHASERLWPACCRGCASSEEWEHAALFCNQPSEPHLYCTVQLSSTNSQTEASSTLLPLRTLVDFLSGCCQEWPENAHHSL